MLTPNKLTALFPHYRYVCKILNQQDVFFVGGCVRDVLLGIVDQPTDIDLTIASTPQDVWERMESTDISRFKTDKFGTITFLPKKQKKVQYELTPFRTEGGYGDFRHPEQIQWSNNLLADSKRRDFTINAIYWRGVDLSDNELTAPDKAEKIDPKQLLERLEEDQSVVLHNQQTIILQDHKLVKKLLAKGKLQTKLLVEFLEGTTWLDLGKKKPPKHANWSLLIDPHLGVNDLMQRQLRAVGDAHQRFGEDALRILRGPRFVNVLNQKIAKQTDSELYFDFDNATWDAMKKNYYLVSYIAKERIKTELEKVFKAPDPFGFVTMLDELRLLGIIFPGVANTKHVEQPIRFHPFDVYNHTILTLKKLQTINKHRLARVAMLYHDVGKPEQYHFYGLKLEKEEKKLPVAGHMYHTNLGVEIAQRDLHQLGFSNKEIEEIVWYIKWHHRPGELLDGKKKNMPKKLRRMISDVGHRRVLHLVDIAIADRLGMYNPIQPPAIQGLKEMKKLVRKLYKDEGRFRMGDLAIDGNELMKIFDLSPGPQVGELLKKAFEWVIEDINKRNKKKKILDYLQK